MTFKGTDIHGGFAPSETKEDRERWLSESGVSRLWDCAGPENRIGYVCYATSKTVDRDSGINMIPPNRYGNFGVSQNHRAVNLNWAENGHTTLGGTQAYATKMTWESILAMLEIQRFACVRLKQNIPVKSLATFFEYVDPETGETFDIPELPTDPFGEHEQKMLQHLAQHQSQEIQRHLDVGRQTIRLNQRRNLHVFASEEEQQMIDLRRELQQSGLRMDFGEIARDGDGEPEQDSSLGDIDFKSAKIVRVYGLVFQEGKVSV